MAGRPWPVPGLIGKGESEGKPEMRGGVFVCTEPESKLRPNLRHFLNNFFPHCGRGGCLQDLMGREAGGLPSVLSCSPAGCLGCVFFGRSSN